MCWEFETLSYDILFGISKVSSKDGSKESSVLVPLANYAPDTNHSGSVILEEPGTYELSWDNSHSWLREKNVTYKIDVVKMEMTGFEKSAYNKYFISCF